MNTSRAAKIGTEKRSLISKAGGGPGPGAYDDNNRTFKSNKASSKLSLAPRLTVDLKNGPGPGMYEAHE